MDDPHLVQDRLGWVQMYQRTGDAGLTCRRCGIRAPRFASGIGGYLAEGEAGLHLRSRRPHRLRSSNVDGALRERILQLRRARNLGPKRIQAELLRHAGTRRSTPTIWKAQPLPLPIR